MKNVHEMRQVIGRTPVFTMANGITLFRLLLLPPIYFLIAADSAATSGLSLLLVGIGWLLDGIDGYVARRLGQVSELGKILDPLVDKIFVLCLLLFLVMLREFPLWVLAVTIPRDVLIMTGGYYLARKRKTVEPANLWGKITTNIFTATAVAYLLRWSIADYFLAFALGLLVISTLNYVRLFLRKLKEAPH
jgi:cardiolipin synthase